MINLMTLNRNGELFLDEFQLEQNKYLAGKLERLQQYKTMILGYPWWVLQADPVLVVHQTYKLNSDVDDSKSYGKKFDNLNRF